MFFTFYASKQLKGKNPGQIDRIASFQRHRKSNDQTSNRQAFDKYELQKPNFMFKFNETEALDLPGEI